MKRWIILVLLLLATAYESVAQTTSTIQGWCESGNQAVLLSGLTSSNLVQQSFPACTVTAFIHGGGTATIFSDANNTPLSNPFTAQSNGRWIFYVAPGRYDVQLSGAGFPTPVTYSDIFTSGAGSSIVIPGGSPIQTQVNNNGTFGGTPCESFGSILTGPENVDCDWHARGPNPWIDITRFGARTCNTTLTPCAVGLTASITGGTKTATISSASTFINGDGVVIYGAGAATTLTVPTGLTVTNVLSQMGTGTGITVPSAVGATTKCYKIIARDTKGGYTAASAETCTTTGQATLGAVVVNLTSCSRAGYVVTCTTSAPHPIAITSNGLVPAEIYTGGSISDSSFRGWRTALAPTDSTHFTYNDSAVNTGNGASASSTGGTVTVFAANHLTWTAVPGAWLYYIYGGASGAETLIGVSRPQNGAINVTDTTFDDFGNLTGNIVFPPWIPTTPPVSGASDNLSTTITAGAGTTTLTLAVNAGTTVSGATIRLDATPALVAAATASSISSSFGGAPVYIPFDPSTNPFQVSSYCDLTPFGALSVIQSGSLWALDTVAVVGTNLRWMGDRVTAMTVSGGGGANTWGTYPKFFVREAIPGLYANSGSGHSVEGVDFQSSVQNGVLLMLVESGFNVHYKDVRWNTGTGSADLIGFGLYLRGTSLQANGGIVMDKVSFSTGLGADGASHATPLFCNDCGDLRIRESYIVHAGAIFNTNPSGTSYVIEDAHYNGGFTPLVSVGGGNSNVTLGVPGKPVIMDTVGHPCVAVYTGAVSVYNDSCGASGYIFQSPAVTGSVGFVGGNDNGVSVLVDSLLGPNVAGGQDGPSSTNRVVLNVTGPGGISVGYNKDAIFVQSPPPAAPSCSVSAGGSVPLGTWTFKTVPYWWNNSQGNPSLPSTGCTTTTGNQTITVNWTIPPGNPQAMGVYASNGGGYALCATCSVTFPLATTSLVWSSNVPPLGTLLSALPLGGATELLPGTQGISAPALILGGSQSVTGVQGTDTNFLSSGTISASTGVSICTDANHGATTSGCSSAGTFYQTVDSNGTAQTQRPTLNFISGANATATCVDNAGATRTDCTFAANATTLWSSITAATNSNAGTFAATGNVWDFSGATSFKIPVAAGAAPTTDGLVADNSTTHGLNFGSNGNTLNAAVASTGAGGTGTTCAANSAVTAISNTAAPTCTQLTGGGLPYTNWGVNSSCSQTGSGAGATQTCTISFNNTEPNTSYKIVCGGTGTITGYPFMQGVITKNTTNAVVQYTNGTSNEAVVSGWANIECIVTR